MPDMLIPVTQVDRDLRLRSATNLSQDLEGFRERFADERACVGYLWEDFHGSKPAYDRRKKTYGSFPNTLGPDYPKRPHVSLKKMRKPDSAG